MVHKTRLQKKRRLSARTKTRRNKRRLTLCCGSNSESGQRSETFVQLETEMKDDESPRLLRKAQSYGAIEETTPLLERAGSRLAATDISDLSSDESQEDFDLLTSTENLRRWISRPVVLPSAAALEPLRRDRRSRSVEDPEVRKTETSGRITARGKTTLVMLAMANLFSTIVYSCIAPFYPTEAASKGVGETAIGLAFGCFELVIFLTAPLFGRYITKIGSKFMFVTGLCVTGFTAVLFGFLNFTTSGTSFIALTFAVRTVEALGDAAFITASFAIAANSFPSRVASTIGLLETFSGLGFTAGPPIGGALYQAGGFELPFWILGGLLIATGFLCLYLIPKQNDAPQRSNKPFSGLLTAYRTWLMIFMVFSSATALSFLDPTLQPFLSRFNLSPFLIGLMFLLPGGVYMITAPLFGYLIDRKNIAVPMMLFGCICTFISFVLIGPAPVLGFEQTLWVVGVSLVVQGFGISAQLVPPFQQCLLIARERDYPDDFETYGLVSAIFQSSVAFGAFFGPTIGGFAVEYIGFEWAATTVGLLNLFCGFLLIIDMLITRAKWRKAVSYVRAISRVISVPDDKQQLP